METIFQLSSLPVLPVWLLMIFAPRWTWTKRILESPLVILPPALLYTLLIVPSIPTALPLLANPSLPGIIGLLGSPAGATIGWIHFLAFDLFVGRWAYLDSLEHKIHPLLMAPILFLILMFGPLGFVLYLGARRAFQNNTGKANTQPISSR